MDCLFHGNSENETDDLGVPHFRKPPYSHTYIELTYEPVGILTTWFILTGYSSHIPSPLILNVSIKHSLVGGFTHFWHQRYGVLKAFGNGITSPGTQGIWSFQLYSLI